MAWAWFWIIRDLLEDCKENVILPLLDGDQLEFEISGLEIMNDDPSDVDVLYGRVKDSTGKLQIIVDSIGFNKLGVPWKTKVCWFQEDFSF